MLRRETAVELPITPLKLAVPAPAAKSVEGESLTNVNELSRTERGSPNLNRNFSADPGYYPRQSTTQNYLVPSMSEPSNQPRNFKKSIESLQKHSSSETEYSLQPYKVIKQSSNETSTSLTGSFNVDQSSFGGHDTSMDTNDTSALNTTVIENVAFAAAAQAQAQAEPTAVQSAQSIDEDTFASPKAMPRQISLDGGMRSLKKQFSIDHGAKPFSRLSDQLEELEDDAKTSLKPPTISTIPATPTRLTAAIGSSSSTDESKDERNIPTISTNTIQDEIAKLSSNISNTGDDETNQNPPINETMCWFCPYCMQKPWQFVDIMAIHRLHASDSYLFVAWKLLLWKWSSKCDIYIFKRTEVATISPPIIKTLHNWIIYMREGYV